MATGQPINTAYPIYQDGLGQPLESGYIYVGTAGLPADTNAITVYWDKDLTVPVTQPIRTTGGFPMRSGSPARFYVGVEDYSLKVCDKNNSQVYVDLNAGANNPIVFNPNGVTGAVSRKIRDKVFDVVSVKDFGALGDGSTDDTAAFQAAIAYCAGVMPDAGDIDGKALYVPQGKYMVDADALVIENMQSLRIYGETNNISSEKDYSSMICARSSGTFLIRIKGDAYNIQFDQLVFNSNELASIGLQVFSSAGKTSNYNSINKCKFFNYPAGGRGIENVTSPGGTYIESALWDITDCGFDGYGAGSGGTNLNLYNAGAWQWVFTRCHFDAQPQTAHCIIRCGYVYMYNCTFDNANSGGTVDVQVYSTAGLHMYNCHSGSSQVMVQELAAIGGDDTTWLNYPLVIKDCIHTSKPAASLQYNGTQPLFIDGFVTAAGAVQVLAAAPATLSIVNTPGFEGTWTPTISSSTGALVSYTSSGVYQKVGNICSVQGTFTITDNGTGAGYIIIEGFPFSATDAAGINGGGRNGTSGNAVSFGSSGVANTLCFKYDGTYPVTTGDTVNFSLTYLTA